MSRRRHAPTPESRKEASTCAKLGVPHHDIAEIMGIDTKTLLKYYGKEMRVGKATANKAVANRLYVEALKGHGWAVCFWMKCQAQWRETAIVQNQTLGADGKPVDPPKQLDLTKPVSAEQAQKDYWDMVGEKPPQLNS